MDMQRLLSQAMKLQEDLSHTQKELDEPDIQRKHGQHCNPCVSLAKTSVSNIEISDEMMDPDNR